MGWSVFPFKKREDDEKTEKMMKNRAADERKVVFIFCFHETDHVQPVPLWRQLDVKHV